jgi:rod shape-determining protein MreC
MRLRDSYRVPILLASCFVAALVFPRACAETRVGVGALLPATAPLTGDETHDPQAAHLEKEARLADEIARLTQELDARPAGVVADARPVRPARTRLVSIAARVRQRDPSPTTGRSFLIDVGREDGVRPGLPVVCGDSLVGLVATASAHAARVVRIDDPTVASTVPATILRATPGATAVGATSVGVSAGGASGVARGTGDGDVRVWLLRQGDAKPGDLAVTGVGNPLIPEGLLLGEVVRFSDDDRDGSFEAYVRPARDLDTLCAVFVVREDESDRRASDAGDR